MIQKTPLVPLSSLTKATRVKVDKPGERSDPDSIRYGGKAPKSERTVPPAAVPPAAVPPAAEPPAIEPPAIEPPAIEPPAVSATPSAAPPSASTAKPIASTAKPIASTAKPVPIPVNAPLSPTRPLGLIPWLQTRGVLDNALLPSRRSLASRYDLFPYGPGLLPDPGPPIGPEQWGISDPPPGGPVLALVGQYGHRPRRGTAPLLSVSFACNFGLRESSQSESGGSFGVGGPFSAGVMLPTETAPYRPNLGQLMGFVLREAAVPPRSFRAGAAPDTLTLLLYFVEPGGEPLRCLFGPHLPRCPLPACLVVDVPDLSGGTHKVPAMVYDAGHLSRPHSLPNLQCLLAIDRGREAAGDISLVSDLVSEPSALLLRDPERYGRAAAQMARLLILGRRPYGLSTPP